MQLTDIISTVSVVIASGGVIIGVLYYFYYIGYLRKVRQTNILMQLFTYMLKRDFLEADNQVLNLEYADYDDFVKKNGPFSSRKPIHIAIRQVINYFEALGVLLEEKLIDEKMVLRFFAVETRWKKLKPIVKELGKDLKLGWFEYIYNKERELKEKS